MQHMKLRVITKTHKEHKNMTGNIVTAECGWSTADRHSCERSLQ